MKKIFSIAMVALAAIAFTSCNKNNNGDNGGEETVKKIARIVKLGDYSFTYNANGTVKSVTENWDGGSETHDFVYEGSNLTIKVGDVTKYTVELNDKGYATKVNKISDAAVYTYTYDAAGFCVSCKLNGVDACQQSIDDNCVEYWTRAKKNDQGEFDHWRHKDHTYLSKDNLGDLHPEWAEDFGQKRWFYETGLLGRGSAKLMSTAQWDDSEKWAKYAYEFDSNGLPTKETKNYGEKGKEEFDTEYTITWELIK
ncbi:MAG: DUF4595 domain-containing protein [Bacteroidales bacterium]|nr:DUF4595 domain-containing protein [Bacteroidales bacterium]